MAARMHLAAQFGQQRRRTHDMEFGRLGETAQNSSKLGHQYRNNVQVCNAFFADTKDSCLVCPFETGNKRRHNTKNLVCLENAGHSTRGDPPRKERKGVLNVPPIPRTKYHHHRHHHSRTLPTGTKRAEQAINDDVLTMSVRVTSLAPMTAAATPGRPTPQPSSRTPLP